MILPVESARFRQSTFSIPISQRSFQGDVTLGKVSGIIGENCFQMEEERKKTDKNAAFQSSLIFNDLLPQGHIDGFSSCVPETR